MQKGSRTPSRVVVIGATHVGGGEVRLPQVDAVQDQGRLVAGNNSALERAQQRNAEQAVLEARGLPLVRALPRRAIRIGRPHGIPAPDEATDLTELDHAAQVGRAKAKPCGVSGRRHVVPGEVVQLHPVRVPDPPGAVLAPCGQLMPCGQLTRRRPAGALARPQGAAADPCRNLGWRQQRVLAEVAAGGWRVSRASRRRTRPAAGRGRCSASSGG